MKENHPTIEGRIFQRFLAKVEADQAIPPEVARRLRELYERGQISAVDRIVDALREGVKEHAKNSTT
jgi:hypothetical protein